MHVDKAVDLVQYLFGILDDPVILVYKDRDRGAVVKAWDVVDDPTFKFDIIRQPDVEV